jgi:hypothetical protein
MIRRAFTLAFVASLAFVSPLALGVGMDYMRGIPNTISADFWQGRSVATTVTVGSSTSSTQILAAKKGDLNLNAGPEANDIVKLRASNSSAAMTDIFSCEAVNGCVLGSGLLIGPTLAGNAQGDIVVKGGSGFGASLQNNTNSARVTVKSGGTIDVVGAVNSLQVGVSGNVMSRIPSFVSVWANAAGAGSTITVGGFINPASGSAQAPQSCMFLNQVAGTGATTCTVKLRDNTTSTDLCTINYTCSAAIQTQSTCTASGTIAAGDVVLFQAITPAASTGATGPVVCGLFD